MIQQVMTYLLDQLVATVDGNDIENGEPEMADVHVREMDAPDGELEEITKEYMKAMEDLEDLRIQIDAMMERWQTERKEMHNGQRSYESNNTIQ